MSYLVDEFDEFCKIAKNPSSQQPYDINNQISIDTPSTSTSGSIRKSSRQIQHTNINDYRLTNDNNNNQNYIADGALNRSRSVRERVIPRINYPYSNNAIGEGHFEEENKIIRVRSFRRTTKGIVCNKDTLEFQDDTLQSANRPKSSISIYRSNQNMEQSNVINNSNLLTSQPQQPGEDRRSLLNVKDPEMKHNVIGVINEYRVQILGHEGVGKTSLVQHLLVPECLKFQYENDDADNENHVMRILVDNKESILHLVDSESGDSQTLGLEPSDAYLIMYSVDDRTSFEACRRLLANVVLTNNTSPVVMLIGNKADLVRCRTVTLEEGKRLAAIYNLKFKEISLSIDHCVDELLVNLITEIRSQHKLSTSKSGPSRMLHRINKSQLRSSLRNKVSHNVVSRFFQRHFNKSYDNVNNTNNE